MVRRNVAIVTVALLAAACHTITEELPEPAPNPVGRDRRDPRHLRPGTRVDSDAAPR